jgi:hypothetical protein
MVDGAAALFFSTDFQLSCLRDRWGFLRRLPGFQSAATSGAAGIKVALLRPFRGAYVRKTTNPKLKRHQGSAYVIHYIDILAIETL